MSALTVILFLGGWLPIINLGILKILPGWFWFAIKLIVIGFIFIWIRGTLPRYRFDQLMSLGWKVILPLSLSLVFYTVLLFLTFI